MERFLHGGNIYKEASPLGEWLDFSANINIICYDHPSLLGEITAFVDDMKLPITAVAVKVNKNKTCSIIMTLKVKSRAQVDEAIKKLQNRSDVIEAYRSAK